MWEHGWTLKQAGHKEKESEMVQHTEIESRKVDPGDTGRGNVYKVCKFMQEAWKLHEVDRSHCKGS